MTNKKEVFEFDDLLLRYPESYFKSLIEENKFDKAIYLMEKEKIIFPKTIIKQSLEDIAIKAAKQFKDKNEYSNAFKTIINYNPEIELAKEYATEFIFYKLADLEDKILKQKSEKEEKELSEEITAILWTEKKYFPKGLRNSENKKINIRSLINIYKTEKLLIETDNLIDYLENTRNYLIKIEQYDKLADIDDKIKEVEEIKLNLKF